MPTMELKEIQSPIRPLLKATDSILKKKIKSNIQLLKRIVGLTPLNKGKKIRSTLLFFLAGMNGVEEETLPTIAASIEMFHLSSLIHDDIVDNSKFRRGEKTLNLNLGNYVSVLAGDYLFIHSLNSLNEIQHPVILNTVLSAAVHMIEGQLLEVDNNYNYNLTPETYLTIVEKKTSALFGSVAEIAATLGKLPSGRLEAFRRFGYNFGTMFQISDDMLDIFSNNSGKDRFRDLKEGKVTLPYIFLLEKDPKRTRRLMTSGNNDGLLQHFLKHDIKGLSLRELDRYYRGCVSFLEGFPPSDYREGLFKLLDFTRDRDY